MQEERDEYDDNSVAASAAFTDASSHHHVTDTDAAGSIHETDRDEELERGSGNKKSAGLHGDKVEDLYSVPKKKKKR